MSVGDTVSESAMTASPWKPGGTSARSSGLAITEVVVAAVALALLSVCLSFIMGRDRNWDYFNYHGYAAFDPFGHRLAQDHFPAGVQGYLNRLAYLPLSLMDAAGWHSAVTGSVMAAVQSLNLLFLYLISRELTTGLLRPRFVAVTLTALGAATNVYWLQVGSTFVDPMTTPPVMAAVWLMLRRSDLRTWLAAGALVGISVALKLTNAPFAAGLIAAALVVQPGIAKRSHQFAAACLGAFIGFVLLYGHWGWRLFELHGSPVFPVFNNIFRSPDFIEEAIAFNRFIPSSLSDLLAFPFLMAQHRSWIYSEAVSPDLRPSVLAVVALLGAVALGARPILQSVRGSIRTPDQAPAGRRRLVLFFVVSVAGWLATSANGRYATPIVLLLGPLIFVSGSQLLGGRRAAMLCLALLPVQGLVLYDAGNPRWAAAAWTSTWLPITVPAQLKKDPQLFLSTSTSSESYLAAHVHPESVFVNPIGLMSIKTGGPGWDRLMALRDQFVGRTKVLFAIGVSGIDAEAREKRVATMNGAIDRLGLELDAPGCDFLTVDEPQKDALPLLWVRNDRRPPESREVAVCDAKAKTPSTELAALRSEAEKILDAFESKCPGVFAPRGVQVEGAGRYWSRLYGKFDLVIVLDSQGPISFRMERQATEVVIGNTKTWQQDLERFDCRLPHDGSRGLATLGGDATR